MYFGEWQWRNAANMLLKTAEIRQLDPCISSFGECLWPTNACPRTGHLRTEIAFPAPAFDVNGRASRPRSYEFSGMSDPKESIPVHIGHLKDYSSVHQCPSWHADEKLVGN
jgi:hypothetical protein